MGRRKKQDSKVVCLTNSSHGEVLVEMLKESSSLTTDLTLVCNGGQIEAHSYILAQRSEVIRMALTDFPKGFHFIVSFPGIRLEMGRCLINFLYTGSVILLGKYVDAFRSVLEDLKIDAETDRSATDTNDGDISIFAPLADIPDEPPSEDEVKYFLDLPPEPKKRNPLKLSANSRKRGRPSLKKEPLEASIIETFAAADNTIPEPEIRSESEVADEPEQISDEAKPEEDGHKEETEEDLSGMTAIFADSVDAQPAETAVEVNGESQEPVVRSPRKRKQRESFNLTIDTEEEEAEELESEEEFSASEMWQGSEEEVDGKEAEKKSRKKLRKRAKPSKGGRKPEEKVKDRAHICAVCKEEFDTQKILYVHYTTHKRGDFYHCAVCAQRFRTFSVLAVHTRKHTGEKPYKCPYCERDFAHQASYDTHVNLHTGEKPYACKECGKGFHNRAALYAHTCELPFPENADPSFLRYECADCHRRFKSRVALGRHKSTHKESANQGSNVLCELCGRGFGTPQLLRQHLKYHSDKRPFSCSSCKKGFFSRPALQNHERSHSGSSSFAFECKVCLKKFRTAEVLEKHERCLHTTEREHACEICTETFRLRSQLENHMLLHTNNVKYQCHCGKLFLNPKYLHKHKLTHIKVAKCMFCRKAFMTPEERDDHELLHHNGTLPVTKNNPAAKSLKSQSFDYYECPVCADGFKSESEVTAHIQREHEVEPEEEMAETEEVEPLQEEAASVYYNNEQVVVVSDQGVVGTQQWPLHYIVMPQGDAENSQVVTYSQM